MSHGEGPVRQLLSTGGRTALTERPPRHHTRFCVGKWGHSQERDSYRLSFQNMKSRHKSITSSWVIFLSARNHLGDGDPKDKTDKWVSTRQSFLFPGYPAPEHLYQAKSLVIPASHSRNQDGARYFFSSHSRHPGFWSITSANCMSLPWIWDHKGVKL